MSTEQDNNSSKTPTLTLVSVQEKESTNLNSDGCDITPDASPECEKNLMEGELDNMQRPDNPNVVSIFTGKTIESPESGAIILRVLPETCGNRMLYSNPDAPERLVAVPLLCWAMDAQGNIFGMVPWLDEVLPCSDVEEKYCVTWEGYYSATLDEIFFEATEDICAQLQLSARYPTGCYHTLENQGQSLQVVQEFCDPIGTHALLAKDDDDGMLLTSVISWALDEHGKLHPMLADESKLEKLPALPGDSCLYSGYNELNFRCLFQRDIADQIRTNNPDTMEAIEQLFAR